MGARSNPWLDPNGLSSWDNFKKLGGHEFLGTEGSNYPE